MNWIPFAEERQARYERQRGELDERALVRQGNVAYAAALGLLMAHGDDAPAWFRRASVHWRESWDAGESREAWRRVAPQARRRPARRRRRPGDDRPRRRRRVRRGGRVRRVLVPVAGRV